MEEHKVSAAQQRKDMQAIRDGRKSKSYAANDYVEEAHAEETPRLLDARQKKIIKEIVGTLREEGLFLDLNGDPEYLELSKGEFGEFQGRAVAARLLSSTTVFSITANKHNEPHIIKKAFYSDDIESPMNQEDENKARLRPGMIIGVWKLERLLNESIKFPDLQYVPTPTGPALNKHHRCFIRFITKDFVSCYVFISKHGTGAEKIPDDERSNYVHVLPEGADYSLPEGFNEALFTRGLSHCDGSMLYLGEYRVHWNEWISICEGSMTEENLVRVRDLTVRNAYAVKHINQLAQQVDISPTLEAQIRSLGMPGSGEKFSIRNADVQKVKAHATPSPDEISIKDATVIGQKLPRQGASLGTKAEFPSPSTSNISHTGSMVGGGSGPQTSFESRSSTSLHITSQMQTPDQAESSAQKGVPESKLLPNLETMGKIEAKSGSKWTPVHNAHRNPPQYDDATTITQSTQQPRNKRPLPSVLDPNASERSTKTPRTGDGNQTGYVIGPGRDERRGEGRCGSEHGRGSGGGGSGRGQPRDNRQWDKPEASALGKRLDPDKYRSLPVVHVPFARFKVGVCA